MRQPVERVEQHERPVPAPASSPRKLSEPDTKFIADLCMAIRAGARVETAALWLGCTRKQWKKWRQRTGGIYDTLRGAIAQAQAHVEVQLQSELARKSPGAALKQLRRVRSDRDDEPEEPPRRYDQSGINTLKRQLPDVVARVRDDTLARDNLAPLEVAARDWREGVIRELGGRDTITTTKLALVNATLGSWLLLNTVDGYLMNLEGGIIDRKHRGLYPIAEQRMRMADSLVRQLQALGLEKQNALPGGINVQRAVVLIPDNGRDPLLSGGTTNGQYSVHRSPAPQPPTPIATVELPPRDSGDFISPNGDQPHDGDDPDGIERDLGLR
jgi:hypothetical protein